MLKEKTQNLSEQRTDPSNKRGSWPISHNHRVQLNDSRYYDTLYGVIVQYALTSTANVKPIKDPPVNSRARNILDVIQVLREAGYNTSRIKTLSGPGPKWENPITEKQLSMNPDLEYLAFILSFDDNPAGVQYLALGRQRGPSGQRDSPQFGYKVGLVKGRSPNGEVHDLLETLKTHAFDYKEVNISPIDPTKLPKGPFI